MIEGYYYSNIVTNKIFIKKMNFCIAMEGDLATQEKGALVVPRIELSDIAALNSVPQGLSEAMKTVEAQYIGAYRAAIEDVVKGAVKGAVKRVRKRKFPFLRAAEYEQVDASSLWGEKEKLEKRLFDELFPKEILDIRDYFRGVGKLCDKLTDIRNEIAIFLRYFFLTPTNDASWERFLNETIPVTEKTFFLIYSDTRVRPFERKLHEVGRGQMESMQMVPFHMDEKHIDFYVQKIFDAVQRYDNEIKRLANLVAGYASRDSQLPDYLGWMLR